MNKRKNSFKEVGFEFENWWSTYSHVEKVEHREYIRCLVSKTTSTLGFLTWSLSMALNQSCLYTAKVVAIRCQIILKNKINYQSFRDQIVYFI